MSTELLKFWLFWVLVPFCLFGLRVARVVWHAAGCFHRRVQNPQNHPCRLRDTSRALLMLSISISAFERAYYPLPTRPDCDFMARCLIFHKNLIKIWWKFDSRTAKLGQKCDPGLPNGVRNAFQDCQMGAEMRSRTAKCGQKWKILKFCIFHFSDFIDRFYIITYGPDLLIARSPAHRSRSTHFILSPQVAVVLNDFPLTGYRVKPPPELWVCTYYPKIKIRASMRDPNFGAGQYPRQFVLAKWRVGGSFWGQLRSKMRSKTAKWGENLKILKNFIFCFFDFGDRLYINTTAPDRLIARGPARRSRSSYFILNPQVETI